MAKLKKIKKVPVSFALPEETIQHLGELAIERGMTKGGVVAAAIRMMYEALKGK